MPFRASERSLSYQWLSVSQPAGPCQSGNRGEHATPGAPAAACPPIKHIQPNNHMYPLGPVAHGGCDIPYPVASNLRHRVFRPLQQPLHFFHINLRCRIVLMAHHLLHPCRARIVKQGKGRGGVPQTMYDNAGFLHSRQAQAFGAGWSLSGLRPSSVFAPRPPIFTPTSTQGR